jgi:sigma-B regulation protein RsbU (phosphoserine phosphatase)
MFTEGGLTTTKIISETLIMAIFCVAALIYAKAFFETRNTLVLFFLVGLIATVYSEAAFVLYKSLYDIYNTGGHILKLLAYILFAAGGYVARAMSYTKE